MSFNVALPLPLALHVDTTVLILPETVEVVPPVSLGYRPGVDPGAFGLLLPLGGLPPLRAWGCLRLLHRVDKVLDFEAPLLHCCLSRMRPPGLPPMSTARL
jgi:hypothetical protein